jgi:ribosome-associated translation inhibitor RaiA
VTPAGGATVGIAPGEKRPLVSETENPRTGSSPAGILDASMHLSGGFSDADRPRLLEALSGLVPHLSRWDSESMKLEVSVKHRDGNEQLVTLRADLAGYAQIVAKAGDRDLDRALAEAKRRLIEQIEDEKKKRDPKSNRLLREK